MKRVLIISTTMVALGVALAAQDLPRRLGGANGPAALKGAETRPVPKLADGTVDLSGVWTGGGDQVLSRLVKPGEWDSLLKPEAKKIMASRNEADDLVPGNCVAAF